MIVSIEKIQNALKHAALSPSSHNCQPWCSVIIDSEAARKALCSSLHLDEVSRPRIIFGLHLQRILTTLPIHAVEMHLSVGAYIQAFLASIGNDVQATVLWINESTDDSSMSVAGWPEHYKPLLVLALDEIKNDVHQDNFSQYLTTRRTNRLGYKNQAIKTEQSKVLTQSRARLDFDNVARLSVQLISDPRVITQFGDFIGSHADIEFTDKAAWAETFRYFRWSKKHSESEGDGFPITQVLGAMPALMKRLYHFVMSPLTMSFLTKLGFAKLLAKDLGRKFGSANAIYILSFPTEDPTVEQQVVAGGYLLDFWLRAESQGLSLWPVSIILQHDHIREKFQKQFELEGRAYFVGKMGVALEELPPAPRHHDPLNVSRII